MPTICTEEYKRLISETSKAVCDYYTVEESLISSKNITFKVVKARDMIFYILHKNFQIPSSVIALSFNRGRRCVFYSCERIKHYIKIYADYRKEYRDIYSKVGDILNDNI